ncbi:hypothetical protein BDV93DRAFT_179766 [Ceratobasidium sp. AG-I]|nr:hypothetical protein BDV93DRAFT_179766 [Ceratobasidium sp. AG-I]
MAVCSLLLLCFFSFVLSDFGLSHSSRLLLVLIRAIIHRSSNLSSLRLVLKLICTSTSFLVLASNLHPGKFTSACYCLMVVFPSATNIPLA